MPEVSRPYTGSWMPSASRLTLLVRPSLNPTGRSPARQRCSTVSACASYAVSVLRNGLRRVNGLIGVASRSAAISTSEIPSASVVEPLRAPVARAAPPGRAVGRMPFTYGGEPDGDGAEVGELRLGTTSPGRTGTIRCIAPGSTRSPRRRPAPNPASVLASQATQRAGCPSTAAPAPLSIGVPLRENSTPSSRRSSSSSGVSRPPSTTRADDALSATVSASRIRQSTIRLSTTSMAGSAPAIAASASSW